MGPRAGLDRCGKSRPYWDSIPDRPARSSVAIPTELPGPLTRVRLIKYIYFLVQCHHMPFVDFVVLPPVHGRSVTDF